MSTPKEVIRKLYDLSAHAKTLEETAELSEMAARIVVLGFATEELSAEDVAEVLRETKLQPSESEIPPSD